MNCHDMLMTWFHDDALSCFVRLSLFEANGKVGEQITDVAADVMVKIATKIGMSPEEQVKCSVEAAKAGPKPSGLGMPMWKD